MLDLHRLDILMKEHGWKSPYICEKLGYSRFRISDWKRGRNLPNKNEINILADLFETTPEYLLGKTDKKEKPAIQKDGELCETLQDSKDREFEIKFLSLSPSQQQKILADIDWLLDHQRGKE